MGEVGDDEAGVDGGDEVVEDEVEREGGDHDDEGE